LQRGSKYRYITFISVGYIFFLVQLKKLGIHGLESPAPRYLVCIMPFIGIYLCSFLAKCQKGIYTFFTIYLAVTTTFLTIVRWCLSTGFFETADGRNNLFSKFNLNGYYMLHRFFPSLFRQDYEPGYLMVTAGLMVTGITVYCVIRHFKTGLEQKLTGSGTVLLTGFSIFACGLSLVLLYVLDSNTPVKTVEAEHMIAEGGESFPDNTAWWKRDWHNWEYLDTGRVMHPGSRLFAYLNKQTTPDLISIEANRTGTSANVPLLKIVICDTVAGEISIEKILVAKTDKIKLLVHHNPQDELPILVMNSWGIYNTGGFEPEKCDPSVLMLYASPQNSESIVVNRISIR